MFDALHIYMQRQSDIEDLCNEDEREKKGVTIIARHIFFAGRKG